MNNNIKWFIADTYINCKGESRVTYLSSQANNCGVYWSSVYRNENMVYYSSEKEATETARNISNSTSIHAIAI